MRKLEIRGGKIVGGGLGSPKGFHLYCTEGVGICTCDTFATAAYIAAENKLYGHSVRVAKNSDGNDTARILVIANTSSDVMQMGGRDRVIACVNHASDKLVLPSSKLRPFFVGEQTERVDNEKIMRGIDECVDALKNGQTSELSRTNACFYATTVQFYLGDDYLCTLSATVFTDRKCPLTKRTLVVTTDVALSQEMLELALFLSVRETFGLIGVPSSVNDGYAIFASGLAGNYPICDRDVEFTKFCKALEFVLNELCCKLLSFDNERDCVQLLVFGAKSKTLAWDVVRNAYTYFSLVGNEDCGIVKGLLSCIGNVETSLRRRRLRVWLQSSQGRLLLINDSKVMYLPPERMEEVLAGEDATLTVDFREGNFNAMGWLRKMSRKVIN